MAYDSADEVETFTLEEYVKKLKAHSPDKLKRAKEKLILRMDGLAEYHAANVERKEKLEEKLAFIEEDNEIVEKMGEELEKQVAACDHLLKGKDPKHRRTLEE